MKSILKFCLFKVVYDFSVLSLMNRVIKTDDVDFMGVEIGVSLGLIQFQLL